MKLSMHKDERTHKGIAVARVANNAMCLGAVVFMLIFWHTRRCGYHCDVGRFHDPWPDSRPTATYRAGRRGGSDVFALLVSPLLIYGTLLLFGRYYVKICSVRKGVIYQFVVVISIIGLCRATYSPFQILLAI